MKYLSVTILFAFHSLFSCPVNTDNCTPNSVFMNLLNQVCWYYIPNNLILNHNQAHSELKFLKETVHKKKEILSSFTHSSHYKPVRFSWFLFDFWHFNNVQATFSCNFIKWEFNFCVYIFCKSSSCTYFKPFEVIRWL